MALIHQFENNFAISNRSDIYFALLNGSLAKDKASFYEQINIILRMPDYFGNNLDALNDALHDLCWIDNQRIFLFIINSNDLLLDMPEYKNQFNSLLKEVDNENLEVFICS